MCIPVIRYELFCTIIAIWNQKFKWTYRVLLDGPKRQTLYYHHFPVCLCHSNQKPQNKVIPPLGLFYSWLFSPLSSSTFLPKNWNKWNIRKFLSISKNDFYFLLLVLKTTVLDPKKNLICVLTENRSMKILIFCLILSLCICLTHPVFLFDPLPVDLFIYLVLLQHSLSGRSNVDPSHLLLFFFLILVHCWLLHYISHSLQHTVNNYC